MNKGIQYICDKFNLDLNPKNEWYPIINSCISAKSQHNSVSELFNSMFNNLCEHYKTISNILEKALNVIATENNFNTLIIDEQHDLFVSVFRAHYVNVNRTKKIMGIKAHILDKSDKCLYKFEYPIEVNVNFSDESDIYKLCITDAIKREIILLREFSLYNYSAYNSYSYDSAVIYSLIGSNCMVLEYLKSSDEDKISIEFNHNIMGKSLIDWIIELFDASCPANTVLNYSDYIGMKPHFFTSRYIDFGMLHV